MKKLFIGLLIIAAGAGIYYFLQKKTENKNNIETASLTGKWKIDSVYRSPTDSASHFGIVKAKDPAVDKYRYDFQKEGVLLQALSDSVKADTSYYQWKAANELLIKNAVKDSTGELYAINKLIGDTLILRSKDSAVFVFTKLK